MDVSLVAQSPFSLPAVIRSHGWVQLAPFVSHDPYRQFSYVARLATGRVVLLQVSGEGERVQVRSDAHLDPAEQDEVVAMVRWMLGLDQNLAPFYQAVKGEPKLEHVATTAQGRILRSPTLFEDTVKTILTTNTSWAGTKRMVKNLVQLYGDPLPGDPSQRAFPGPGQLATVDVDALRQEAKLGYRAPYVRELAQRVADGELALEALKESDLSTPALRQELLDIKGIGAYAAANLLLILGRSDFIPVDSYALKMVSREFHEGASIGPQEVHDAFADWGEWQGLAFWFWDWGGEG